MYQNGEERDRRMAKFNFIHGVSLPKMVFGNPFASALRVKRHERNMSRKNVKLIKEFLRERRKQQTDITGKLAQLKEQRKSKSIDKATYDRLQKVLLGSHEMKRIETLDSLMLRLKS